MAGVFSSGARWRLAAIRGVLERAPHDPRISPLCVADLARVVDLLAGEADVRSVGLITRLEHLPASRDWPLRPAPVRHHIRQPTAAWCRPRSPGRPPERGERRRSGFTERWQKQPLR
jgi:hypothetical protein